jgi:N-succinyldiaminopimelate aminotransferase
MSDVSATAIHADRSSIATDGHAAVHRRSMSRSPMAGRVEPFGTTVFAEMSALAREHGAVNLGQGFPDFDGPAVVREAAAAAIMEGRNQYAISHGELPLRQAIAEHAERFYRQRVDPDREVTVTAGATEAIWCAAFAFLEPGDEVILFEPSYDSYVPGITSAGGVPVPVTLHAPDFRFDPDELRRAITPRTRAIYVNTPHNPSGAVFDDGQLDVIATLCIEHDLLAVADEVYEHIVFAPAAHRRLATLPGMWERTLTISSGGKSFSLTGWKAGWAIGPAPLQTALRRVHQFTVFASTTPVQHGIAAALRLPDSYFRELAEDYRARRDFLMTAIAEAGLEPIEPKGSYFIVARYNAGQHGSPFDFSRHLVREVGVATIPLDTFYLDPARGHGLIRFCFCKKWETLHTAAERLARLRR